MLTEDYIFLFNMILSQETRILSWSIQQIVDEVELATHS